MTIPQQVPNPPTAMPPFGGRDQDQLAQAWHTLAKGEGHVGRAPHKATISRGGTGCKATRYGRLVSIINTHGPQTASGLRRHTKWAEKTIFSALQNGIGVEVIYATGQRGNQVYHSARLPQ